jgi:LuxR family maltose regulon positive regulatory protein
VAGYAADARAYALEVGDPASLLVADSYEARLAPSTEATPAAMSAPGPHDVMLPWLEVPSLTYAQVLLRSRSSETRETALLFIEDALARAEAHHNVRQAIPFSLLKAEALAGLGRSGEALDLLAATVRRARPLGLVRTFVDYGPHVKELLDELPTPSGSDDQLAALRSGLGDVEPGQRTPAAAVYGPNDQLTHRELETLDLLAWRMTNKEIAERLSVSSAAVKKRLESIYAKLGVHDRRAAVAEAVACGLINAPTR